MDKTQSTGVTQGPVAVVTGARRGIGRRIAETLAAEGHDLALIDVAAADETEKAVKAAGRQVVSLVGDVSREQDVVGLAEQVYGSFGRVDVLVNNAGVNLITPTEELTGEDWNRVLGVNLTGPFLCSREFGRRMLTRRRGGIVNISSLLGLQGAPDRASYAASKHGVIGLTRSLAVEWGARGVRVNAVCPGYVNTDMNATNQARGFYTAEDITERSPMGRFAEPDDVAQAVAFLADERRSGYVNGVALSVDGGWTADASWHSLRLSKR
ncbi:SDR family NAD(P)-dependent oxidoreductase [Streptomyces sp. NPDC053750]|uniref:SDR family NAD(P)-dependent oxidoreductase n=1 Tax=Streptomyces sp. NPDC053750 TaxID=3365714 RepID=UPI0037D59BD0